MNYISFYELACDVFNKNNLRPNNYFMSHDMKQGLGMLNSILRTPGNLVITGETGYGKTVILNRFVNEHRNSNCFTPVYINMTNLTRRDFFKQLCMALNLDAGPNTNIVRMFYDIQAQIYRLDEGNTPMVLFIDEAHGLRGETLHEFPTLMNQQYDRRDHFSLILCGRPELLQTLHLRSHEALEQRINHYLLLRGLDRTEVEQYVIGKLVSGNGREDIVSTQAFDRIFSATGGIPRKVDRLMSVVMGFGAQNKLHTIGPETVDSAVNYMRTVSGAWKDEGIT